MNDPVTITELDEHPDQRGESFAVRAKTLEFLDRIDDMHIATVKPGFIRGNHYHLKKREFIVVVYHDSWLLGYQQQDQDNNVVKQFEGRGAIAIEIEKGVAHAIKNTGSEELIIAACSSKAYDIDNPDLIRKNVL